MQYNSSLCHRLIGTKARIGQFHLLSQALELIPAAVSIADPAENRLLYVNLAWCKVYRYSAEEVLGRTPRILNLVDESDSLINEIINKTKLGGWSGRLMNQDKFRNIFPVQLRTCPLMDPDGKIIGLIGIGAVDRIPSMGPEQIQSIIDSQAAALRQTLSQASNPIHLQLGARPQVPRNIKILTPREREIFLLFGNGLSPDQIAERLHLSVRTIYAHRANMCPKLGLPDSSALTYWAARWHGA